MKPQPQLDTSSILSLVIMTAAPDRVLGAGNLWSFAEVYSNTNGAIQYIKMIGRSNGEQYLCGRLLTCSATNHMRTFTFPRDLTSHKTAKRYLLLATRGYASLASVPAPDFTIPDSFLRREGGTLDFDDVSFLKYPPLPGGSFARTASGERVPTSPTNFSGESGFIVSHMSNQAHALSRRSRWANGS